MWIWVWGTALAADTRLLLIGDAGHDTIEVAAERADDDAPCVDDPVVCELAAMLRSLRDLAASERRPDAVLVLGDNMYGPGWLESSLACDPDDTQRLERVVKRYRALTDGLGDLPVYGVLGNHDVGHGWVPPVSRRRRCATAAMVEAGWNPQGDGRVVELGGGVIRLLDTNRIIGPAWARDRRANTPAFEERSAAWEVWAGHHAWSLQWEKGREPTKLRRRIAAAEGYPAANDTPRLWVNGHAHHQEASVEAGVLAVTSGSGSERREASRPRRVDPPDQAVYSTDSRGYTVIDLHADEAGGPVTVDLAVHGFTTDGGDVVESVQHAQCTSNAGSWRCGPVTPVPGGPG